jgi:hypothetical protein
MGIARVGFVVIMISGGVGENRSPGISQATQRSRALPPPFNGQCGSREDGVTVMKVRLLRETDGIPSERGGRRKRVRRTSGQRGLRGVQALSRAAIASRSC